MRLSFRLKLNPGCKEEYLRRHNPVWLKLEEVFKDYGVKRYSIFLDDKTNDLFASLEVESEEQWKQSAQSEVVQKWRKFMQPLLESNDDGTPKVTYLMETYSFNPDA